MKNASSISLLLRWYRRHGRDLPWRRTRDGYRLFLSELMLQQTQVDRVLPKYAGWLERFPSWESLARASTPMLLRAWAGLGYNRRALQAREAARHVLQHGEPQTEEEWRLLPGVGPYVAAALAEFVNHRRAIVIDTNVRRVAGRAYGGIFFPTAHDDVYIRQQLEREIPLHGKHWDVPQAFMDVGSMICLPRSPRCQACPLRQTCRASEAFLSPNPPQRARGSKPAERRHRDKEFPDRIYRGKILALVRRYGVMPIKKIGPLVDERFDAHFDQKWIEAMVRRMADDGLLRMDQNGFLRMPK